MTQKDTEIISMSLRELSVSVVKKNQTLPEFNSLPAQFIKKNKIIMG